MGKPSRDKGARMERAVVAAFQDAGFCAERIPLSGAAGGKFKGDVTFPLIGRDWRTECKKRANGFRELYGWLADNDALIVAADRQPALAVVPLTTFLALARIAEGIEPPRVSIERESRG